MGAAVRYPEPVVPAPEAVSAEQQRVRSPSPVRQPVPVPVASCHQRSPATPALSRIDRNPPALGELVQVEPLPLLAVAGQPEPAWSPDWRQTGQLDTARLAGLVEDQASAVFAGGVPEGELLPLVVPGAHSWPVDAGA